MIFAYKAKIDNSISRFSERTIWKIIDMRKLRVMWTDARNYSIHFSNFSALPTPPETRGIRDDKPSHIYHGKLSSR